jgi:hypothetical protein
MSEIHACKLVALWTSHMPILAYISDNTLSTERPVVGDLPDLAAATGTSMDGGLRIN